MTDTAGLASRRRRFTRFQSAVLATGLFVLAGGVTWAWRGVLRQPVQVPQVDGLRVSLSVEPFEVGDSAPANWNASGFADSLAAQLSMIRGIRAASSAAQANYVLRGHVTMKEGRLILAALLAHEGKRDTVWTATFWRSATPGSSVMTDLATAVAEAVFTESARAPFAEKRDEP